MSYAFRFKAEIGDVVWAVTDSENGDIQIDKVTIFEIQDNSYTVKIDKTGCFSDDIVRAEDFENYSIGYWIKEFSFGHAMYFGETLFLTEQEAQIEAQNIEKELKEEELI